MDSVGALHEAPAEGEHRCTDSPVLCARHGHLPLARPAQSARGELARKRLRGLPGPRRRWRMKWAGQHRSRAIGGPSRKQAREWHSRQGGQRWTYRAVRPTAPLRHFVTPLPRDAASRLGRGKEPRQKLTAYERYRTGGEGDTSSVILSCVRRRMPPSPRGEGDLYLPLALTSYSSVMTQKRSRQHFSILCTQKAVFTKLFPKCC